MRFLVAGGTGYLGTALRRRLEQDGHEVTGLTRHEPGQGQVRWDPARAPLGVEVVENADVVVNVCGSSLLGNPHSSAYARRLFDSRVQTTRTLAEAIAASDRKPAFLAGNGTSYYGDHGDEPINEDGDSRGEALLTRVTRDWQAATEPAAAAGARTCVLRTAPVFGRGSMVATTLRRLFRLGLGGRLGDGRQYFALVSTHDWVEAVARLAADDTLAGPVNLVAPDLPTNAEFTKSLGKVLHRPTVVPVPAPAIKLVAGPMAPELLNSVRAHPRALLDAGFVFRHPDGQAVLAYAFAGRLSGQ
jgi:uncharacterized protein (TIGR01777 family)